ncbi:MAG: hypothetical protein ABI541_13330 [Betaproteobacteria bacterium]
MDQFLPFNGVSGSSDMWLDLNFASAVRWRISGLCLIHECGALGTLRFDHGSTIRPQPPH